MKIRQAEISDLPILDKLLKKLIIYESQFDCNLDIDCIIQNNYNQLINMDKHTIYVAEVDNNIVGFLYGFVYQIPNMWKNPVAIIDALYIVKEFRNNGYGTALIKEFESFAKLNKACRVELKVIAKNNKAIRVYRKQNFKENKLYMCKSL